MKNILKVKFNGRLLGEGDSEAVTSLLTGSTSAKSIRKGERMLPGIPDTLKIEVDGLSKPITGAQFKTALAAAKTARDSKRVASLVVFKVTAADKAISEADSLLAAMAVPASR